MYDRRRHKRLPLTYELSIHELFDCENHHIEGVDGGILLTNISKTGIGFVASEDLPLDYFFDAKVSFSDTVYFYCVLKIVRKAEDGPGWLYGCEFVGMPEFIKSKIDEYEDGLRD